MPETNLGGDVGSTWLRCEDRTRPLGGHASPRTLQARRQGDRGIAPFSQDERDHYAAAAPAASISFPREPGRKRAQLRCCPCLLGGPSLGSGMSLSIAREAD